MDVIAPDNVPGDVNLTLQIKKDSDTQYVTRYIQVASGERLTLGGLEACTWYAVRWVGVSQAPDNSSSSA